MKQRLMKIKELGIQRIIVAIIAAFLLIGSIIFLASRVCFMQHKSDSDYEFFMQVNSNIDALSDGNLLVIVKNSFCGIWAVIVAAIYKITGCHPLFFCHTIIPFVFVFIMVIEYLYLGYRLFSFENRTVYYTYTSTVCFVTVFLFLQYFLAYNSIAPEGGVYINCWRESVITGILLLPLPICTVLRRIANKKKKARDIVLLLIEAMLILSYTSSVVTRIYLKGKGELSLVLQQNIDISWFFVMTIGFVLLSFGLKQKAIVPLTIIIALSLVLLCPLAVGLLISYGFTSLVTHEDKNYGWMFLSYAVFGLVIFMVSRVYGDWVNYSCVFEPIENKYKISSSIPELYDYLEQSEMDSNVIMAADWADEMEIFAPEIKILSLEGVDDVNFAETLEQSGEHWDYVCMHTDMSVGEMTLYENGYMIDQVFDDAIVFKKSQ